MPVTGRLRPSLLFIAFAAAFVAAGEGTYAQPADQGERRFRTAEEAGPVFADEEEALRFLATAPEVSWEFLPTGVTRPKRLVLEQGGVRARAVFHYIDEASQETKRLPNGRTVQYFRDSYRNQVAAYVLARLLGFDNVPPTLLRSSGGQVGSAQLWIENAMMESERTQRDIEHPRQGEYVQQYFEMRVFDNIINNIDRNQTNILFDQDWNLWMIDHTRTFGRDKALAFPEMVKRCSREVWERLAVADPKEVRTALQPYLGTYEIAAVVSRLRKVTKILEGRLAELGEERVLFTRGAARLEGDAEIDELPPGAP